MGQHHERQAHAPPVTQPDPYHRCLRGQQAPGPGVGEAGNATQRLGGEHGPMIHDFAAGGGRRAKMSVPTQSRIAPMSLDPALRSRITTLLADNRVVLFMKGHPQAPQCGFSAKAAGALNALGIDYAHVDVLADPEIREGIKAYGEWPTIPQLYIGGELVGGSDIIEQMANSGELQGALGLPPPDRTPPRIEIGPAAVDMLRNAIKDAGGDVVVRMDIDPQ